VKCCRSALWLVLILTSALASGPDIAPIRSKPLPRLKVSDNKRFLVTEEGKPFFYLADTGGARSRPAMRASTARAGRLPQRNTAPSPNL
jgi:hypothetical protein